MGLRRLRPARKRLPPAPFVNVEDRPAPVAEYLRNLAELVGVITVLAVAAFGALAVALILQATWWPIAGGVAAILILLLILI